MGLEIAGILGREGRAYMMNIQQSLTKEHVEYPSAKKLFGLTFASMVFVAVGILLIVVGQWEEETPIIMIIIGFISVGFFGLCLIYCLYRLMNKRPSIIINGDGIMDNSSYIGGGLLKWSDIQDVVLYEFMGQRFIGLKLHDIERFMAQQSGMKKALIRMNKRMINMPVNIPQSGVRMPLDQLYTLIKETWMNAAVRG